MTRRRLALASAALSAAALASLTALSAISGDVPWSVAFASLTVASGALWQLAFAWGRPGWTPPERAVLRGGMDAGRLFEVIPRREGLR